MVMIQHTLHYLAFKRAQQRPPRERDNPGSILDWVMWLTFFENPLFICRVRTKVKRTIYMNIDYAMSVRPSASNNASIIQSTFMK